MDDSYLVISGGRALWGWQHGIRWLPVTSRLARTVCAMWNAIACRALGHFWIDDSIARCNGRDVCSHCTKLRPIQPDHVCMAEAITRALAERDERMADRA